VNKQQQPYLAQETKLRSGDGTIVPKTFN